MTANSWAPEFRGLGMASFKASLTGSALSSFLFTAVIWLYGNSGWPETATQVLVVVGLAFVIAFFTSIIGVMLCLTAIGIPIAMVMRGYLEPPLGLVIVLGLAIVIAVIPVILLGEFSVAAIVLAYGIPAAYFYREQILVEKAIS